MALSRFAQDDAEAERRYGKYRDIDPFPQIQPALLNSADIGDYVAATGMVFPFREDSTHLKAASYRVPLLGRYVYWDGQDQQVSDIISASDPFILKANSIAFVTLEPLFRVPNYIAIRFNLRITNIYRGILLGTGPLVDPGFVGRLSIPLHNLTINDYPFHGGEGLIWMEFTKISRHPQQEKRGASPRPPTRRGKLFGIQPDKADPDLDVRSYLTKAWPAGPIRSSITDATLEATQRATDAASAADATRKAAESAADTARLDAERRRRIVTGAGAIAVLTVVVGIAAIILQSRDLVNGVSGRLDALSREIARVERTAPDTATVPPIGASSTTAPANAIQDVVAKVDAILDKQEAISDQLNRDRERDVTWLIILTALVLALGVASTWSIFRIRRNP